MQMRVRLRVPLWRMCTLVALGALAFFVVGAGAATGGHVGCGDTITQDTKLDHDLIDCPGNGIIIGADNITLDLNGHTVDGDANAAYGVWNPAQFPARGHDGVTITGGTIRQFFFGAVVDEARDNALHRLAVTDNFVAIAVASSDDIIIALNHVSDNRLAGLTVSSSASTVIRNNSIVRSGCGLWLTSALGESVVEHNTVLDNRFCGLRLADSFSGHRVRVTDNLLQGNRIGIHVVDSTGNEIVRNSVSHSPVGISLANNPYGNRIERNSLSDNEFGIKLETESHDNLISGNFLTNNSRSGIVLAGFPAETNDNNQVVGNIAFGNGEDGIFIGSENVRNLVSGNITHRNGDDGIDVDSPTNLLTGNIANRNGDLGIEAVPGLIDGGGNRASGNGNPVQCVNVACR